MNLVRERVMKHDGLLSLQAFIVLCAGAILVCTIILLTNAVPAIRFLFEAHTFGPMSEEIFKFVAAVVLVAFVHFRLWTIPLLGTSFGIVEAVRHMQVYGKFGGGAIIAHVVFGITMTILLYVAVRAKTAPAKFFFYSLAILVPIALHIFYNLMIVPHLL